MLLAVAALAVALDQTTKTVAVASLEPGESVPVVQGVLHWTLQFNPGAAFGLFQRFPVAFTILAATITVGILANLWKVTDRTTAIALGLVLGGAVGNLIDRIARQPGVFRGHVVDFIDFRVWPVFNFADAAVVIGAGLLVLGSWQSERRERAQEIEHARDGERAQEHAPHPPENARDDEAGD
jgi:signal peptidase II